MELSELSLSSMLLFLFSSIGVLNILVLTLYFLFFVKNRSVQNRLLATLLLVIGMRELKSVLALFLGNGVEVLGFFGQTVDTLIGPLLYFYVLSYTSVGFKRLNWILHSLPYPLVLGITYFIIKFIGRSYYDFSTPIGGIIYIQWIIYILLSTKEARLSFETLAKEKKLQKQELWLITLIGSVFVIWLAYLLTHFGNYVLGGVSISVVLYLSLMLWIYKGRPEFQASTTKYASKKIPEEEAQQILSNLNQLMIDSKQYLSPTIKLAEVASTLNLSPHMLSQILNDNLQKGFNHYINQFRIQAAAEMIKDNQNITLEAIGVDCGFKSKSAFYTAFKTLKGQTPAQFRKAQLSN